MDINVTLIGQTVAFLVFVVFCYKYVWPPLTEAIEKRQKEIADSINTANSTRESIEKEKGQASLEVENAKLRAKELVVEAERQASKIVEEAQAKAILEKNRIKEQAKEEIAQERAQAKRELRAEVSGLAVSIAEKIIQAELKDKDYSDIIDNALEKL